MGVCVFNKNEQNEVVEVRGPEQKFKIGYPLVHLLRSLIQSASAQVPSNNKPDAFINLGAFDSHSTQRKMKDRLVFVSQMNLRSRGPSYLEKYYLLHSIRKKNTVLYKLRRWWKCDHFQVASDL